MALPNSLGSYSTLQGNYNRLAGVQPTSAISQPSGYDPIQYNQPVQQLRQNRDVININTNGGNTSQDRINRQATRLAEQQAAQLRSTGEFMKMLEPQRIQAMNSYTLTPYEQGNFNRLRSVGYSDAYAFANAGSGAGASNRPNSIEGRWIQGAFDRDQRDQQVRNSITGYTPSNALEQSYQRLLGRI